MNIPIDKIKGIADKRSYSRGLAIKNKKLVYGMKSEYNTESEIHFSGYIEGSYDNEYFVNIYYDEIQEEIVDYHCECPAYHQYNGMCKHCVALALHFAKTTSKSEVIRSIKKGSEVFLKPKTIVNKNLITSKELTKLIYQTSMEHKLQFMQPEFIGKIDLVPILVRSFWGWSVHFKIGAENKYVLKDINKLLALIELKEEFTYGVKLRFIHDYTAFTEDALNIIDFLKKYLKTYKYISGLNYMYMPAIKELELPNQAFAEFLHVMSGKTIQMENVLLDSKSITVVNENPPLSIYLEKSKSSNGYTLTLPKVERIGDESGMYLRVEDIFYECSKEFSEKMYSICSLCDDINNSTYFIHENDMTSFCGTVLPIIKRFTNFQGMEEMEKYYPKEPVIKIYLDRNAQKITCKINADYGNEKFNVLKSVETQDVYRDMEKESTVLLKVMQYFNKREENVLFYIDEEDDDRVFRLVMDGIDDLKELGEVYVSEQLNKVKVHTSPKISVGVSIKAGLLDLEVKAGDFSQKELDGILQNYRVHKKYYKLKNGDYVSIEDNALEVLSELTDYLAIKKKNISNGNLQVPVYRAMYIEQLLKEHEVSNLEINRDKDFNAIIRNIKSFDDSDFEVPKPLDNIMRNYQKTGYRWLRTIDLLKFGGILADDMGLGKSIQIISYLIGKKQESIEKITSLIVCPASLIYNWENELHKFGNQLSVLILAGNHNERKEGIKNHQDYDVVVTSYDLLKRDLEYYNDLNFYAMIIDEAQYIKNHTTQVAKAVKLIQANVRFALTGTPIENRLSELWSIFDFIMPGLLYSYQKFKNEFETNIMLNHHVKSVSNLQRMIKPFIMRRVKEDVLKEIPDKNEEIIYSKLSVEEEKLYNGNVLLLKNSMKHKNAAEFNQDKIKILAGITRLRQICCAPALVYEDYHGSSAKIDTCIELILDAVEGGHKILLFSQFTSVFDLLEPRLKKEKISFFRLEGSTSKIKRSEMVDLFNKDETSLFLISLKAGGTGLNLTRATIVIHFDPWWNIAAQNQATDRTHRIGQTKVVTVFKLIAKNTIEEKILQLQQAKQELSEQIINEGGASIANLTKEDLEDLLE